MYTKDKRRKKELIMDHHKRVQTSEAFINSAFLAVSGGFQDAYTYFTRDGVFSNAQTGNVVLMSERFMNGEVKAGLHYLIPLTAFFLGVLLAERIQEKFRYARRLHWRQGILLVEIILLFLVGFIPGNLNVLATTLVSALSAYMRERKPRLLRQALCYFAIIFLFAIGAGIGGRLSMAYGERAIWVSSILLLISFLLMFIEEIEEAEHRWQ